MAHVHLAVALAVLLVLAGCTGGAGPSATQTTGETEAPMGATTTDESTATTAGEPETTASPPTATEDENGSETLPEEGVFEYYGVEVNYSAGGDLDADAIARSHLGALEGVESLTASAVSRTEVGNRSTVTRTALERDADRSLFRTTGAGANVSIYNNGKTGAMKTVRDGEANYLLLGNASESAVEAPGADRPSAFVMVLAKLQAMPYEEVGTVTRDGTTLTKYEATGPGYYADGALSGDASVESYSSTVLVGEDGVVRLFHQSVVVERGGETAVEETTLRYEDVGSTTVTPPEWAENVLNETDEGDDDYGDSDG